MEGQSGKILILVDYSNLLYRAYFSSLKDIEIKAWIPFVRCLDMLRTCVKHVTKGKPKGTKVEFIFCGDSVRKKLDRMKVDENYKADRPPLTNLKFYIFRNVMQVVLADMGFEVYYHNGSEGDDVIASIVHKVRPKCGCEKKCEKCLCEHKYPNTEVVIFSADKDLHVLLGYKDVTIYKQAGYIYSKEIFEKEYGFHPKHYCIYKSLVGDKSDGIKGVSGWGKDRARRHILKGTVNDILQKERNKSVFEKCYALIDLNYDIPDVPIVGQIPVVNESDVLKHKLKVEYFKDESVADVIFGEKRLRDACKEALA